MDFFSKPNNNHQEVAFLDREEIKDIVNLLKPQIKEFTVSNFKDQGAIQFNLTPIRCTQKSQTFKLTIKNQLFVTKRFIDERSFMNEIFAYKILGNCPGILPLIWFQKSYKIFIIPFVEPLHIKQDPLKCFSVLGQVHKVGLGLGRYFTPSSNSETLKAIQGFLGNDFASFILGDLTSDHFIGDGPHIVDLETFRIGFPFTFDLATLLISLKVDRLNVRSLLGAYLKSWSLPESLLTCEILLKLIEQTIEEYSLQKLKWI